MKKVILFFSLVFSPLVMAGSEIYSSFFSSKAISGYDTVAYFTEGKPVQGKSEHSVNYKGVDWLFSSAENLAKFNANPDAYAPQYGGHCAWAVAEKNTKYSADPLIWTIVDNKLYLNYDQSVQIDWVKDVPGFITQGDNNWPDLRNK